MPERLANHELVQAAWEGLNASKVWDMHVHLIGNGDSGSGAWANPAMYSLLQPFDYLHGAFYANAACLDTRSGDVDRSYVARLSALHGNMRQGARLMLLAMDYFHDAAGTRLPEKTMFHVPNQYAARVAQQHPDKFEWAASIHPYRADCVDALEDAVKGGARAVKWLPSAMGIDPSSPKCDRFYEALKQSKLPLLSHGGYEHPVLDSGMQAELNNPLALRRALAHGIRVIISHAASTGENVDTDQGANGPIVQSFTLFTRMMNEPRYEGLLYGDISALTEPSRTAPLLKSVLLNDAWQGRLLNGSDYPLPGYMPGMSMAYLVDSGFLKTTQASVLNEMRKYNPLLFDFVLKRHLSAGGKRFAAAVFETQGFFAR